MAHFDPETYIKNEEKAKMSLLGNLASKGPTIPIPKMPKWFKDFGLVENITLLDTFEDVVHSMNTEGAEGLWSLYSSNYYIPDRSRLKHQINLGLKFYHSIILDIGRANITTLPIETICKATMNSTYAKQCLELISLNSGAQSIRVFEIGAGAGFMAPLLLMSTKYVGSYVHHDTYQPYFMCQQMILNALQYYDNRYYNIDLSIVEADQSLKYLFKKRVSRPRVNKSSNLNLIGLGLNQIQGLGLNDTISLPWWHVDNYLNLTHTHAATLWVANDCLQEFEPEQAIYWVDRLNSLMGKDDLLLVSGTGAPHSFKLWDILKGRAIRPLFMGHKSVPFTNGPSDIFELHIYAKTESNYFNTNDCNLLTDHQYLVISRGIHGEVDIGGGMPEMCYIDPGCHKFISAVFPSQELRIPRRSGLFYNGVEQ
jgi:hypothetical protein